MSRRHDEADWEARVDRFVRSPKRVVPLDFVRRAEPKPEPETETEPTKETTEP